jgi:hypothetical protein
LNTNRWDQAVGSVYKTTDGRSVRIVAYSVRLPELTSSNTVEDVHGALIDELVDGKPQPIKDHGQWKRLLFDQNGTHKGGDLMSTPELDLVGMVRGAAR